MFKKIIHEPLVHFILISGFFFLLYGFLNPNEGEIEDNTILIDQADIERIKAGYQKNWGSSPDSSTLARLIETAVKTEIYYREALRMNLDHNDEIVKRRLQQKYEFLVKDLASMIEPTSEQTQQFYAKNSALFQTPKTLSFTQYYFSPDKRKQPLQDAKQALLTLKNQTPEQVKSTKIGDSFHLQDYFSDREFELVWQQFGRDFADTLFVVPQIGWTIPIKSGYGVHLVYISNIQKTTTEPLEKVKEQVKENWKEQQLQLYNEQLYKNLRKDYTVSIEY